MTRRPVGRGLDDLRQEALGAIGDPEADGRERQLAEDREEHRPDQLAAALEHDVEPRVRDEQRARRRRRGADPGRSLPGGDRRQHERSREAASNPAQAMSQCSVAWCGFSDDESQSVHGSRPTPIAPKTTITYCRSVQWPGRMGCLHCRRMTVTEFEAVPAVEHAPRTPGLVVMKFGGTSVGDTDKLKRVAQRLVAARRSGSKVVAVVSAMGHTTDELVDLAHESPPRRRRGRWTCCSRSGERISCALVAMAIVDLGGRAISLTGSQAGIVTDSSHTKAKIVEVRARRIHEALERDEIVLVAGFQGVSTPTRST